MQEATQTIPLPQTLSPLPAADVLDRLLPLFSRHFDIERDCQLFGRQLPAKAHFYSRGERYVLTKKAKLWGVECNEHILFFTPAHFGAEQLREVLELLDECERELVHPHEEHMYTYLSAIVLAGSAGPEAAKALARYKKRRNYRLSLHGWSLVRLALADLSAGTLHFNRDGKDFRKILRKLAG